MIKSVNLKNFRQHKGLAVNFQDGTTIIRGLNEAGKSTLFEAVTFAMFGIRACRNNDVTTWGEPENSHAVTVTFDAGPVSYVLKRSTRGAEITWDGGRVTGQTEVTKFCEEVLELKPGTGSKLMFVGQNAMRGVLEEGGSRASQMIEQLANFDQIECWVNKLQEDYSTGNTKVVEATLDSLAIQLKDSKETLEKLQDPNERAAQLKETLLNQNKELQSELAELTQAHKELEAQLAAAIEAEEHQRKVQREIDITRTELKSLEAVLSEPLVEFNHQDLTKGEAALSNLEVAHQKHLEDKLLYQTARANYNKLAGTVFDEASTVERLPLSASTAAAQQQSLLQERDSLSNLRAETQADIKHLRSHLTTELQCPTCKREWDDVEQMKEANEKAAKEITEKESVIAKLDWQLEECTAQLNQLSAALRHTAPSDLSGWTLVDDQVCPAKYKWEGQLSEPGEFDVVELNEARDLVNRLKFLSSKSEDQGRRLQVARDRSQVLQRELSELEIQLKDLGRGSGDLRPALYDLSSKLQDVERTAREVLSKLDNFDEEVKPWLEEYARWESRVEGLKQQHQQLSETLADTQLNNSLLKALRTIKPQVANKVWNTVCASISHYFSLMRGCQSAVTKGDSGFLVDGRDTASLSGSTLDILGIAIRVALTKTFMPSCRFLLLDEPFAACDLERQTQALGVVTSSGFDQVIIITHEDVSESASDHLFEL